MAIASIPAMRRPGREPLINKHRYYCIRPKPENQDAFCHIIKIVHLNKKISAGNDHTQYRLLHVDSAEYKSHCIETSYIDRTSGSGLFWLAQSQWDFAQRRKGTKKNRAKKLKKSLRSWRLRVKSHGSFISPTAKMQFRAYSKLVWSHKGNKVATNGSGKTPDQFSNWSNIVLPKEFILSRTVVWQAAMTKLLFLRREYHAVELCAIIMARIDERSPCCHRRRSSWDTSFPWTIIEEFAKVFAWSWCEHRP
ncbi:MAG: hypothetical protein FWD31_02450 [Planctomycetaceae bacterium]|nr:hypothetical protein [Planctomycetaceae bacterium]